VYKKNEITDLARFGGSPAVGQRLYVGRPNICNRERLMARITKALDNRWFSNNGPYVQDFEKQLAALIGVRHCIAMCNGTIALEIAIRALGLKGEVIIPSFTFIATAHALQWQEITPVFCDIGRDSHLIDPNRVEELITPRTTGIVGVHLWGRGCNTEALAEIASRHNLKLIFDAAHAFGCSIGGRMIGNFGDAEVFSFHATKFFNTFEGGAVTTNDDELAARMRLMKNFGFAGFDNVIYVGTNGKMNEISAIMGLTSLESVKEFISSNRRNYEQYQQELQGVPGLEMLRFDEEEKANYQYIVVEVDENSTGISRDQLLEVLWAENIIARRYFYPGCHQMEPYRSHFPHARLLLPETERLVKRVLVLPTGTAIGAREVQAITEVLRFTISHSEEITARLLAA
jgi:dTDP-4-amino-4,6-dideoxygalactose transaminase